MRPLDEKVGIYSLILLHPRIIIRCILNTKFTRFVLRLSISLGIIGAFVYYLYNSSDKYLELLDISKMGVLGLFLLSLMFPLLNGMQNTYLYRGLGLSGLSHWDSFLITAASTLANQLPLPGGIISRGYYLKEFRCFSTGSLLTRP
jgi:hypothetical protein